LRDGRTRYINHLSELFLGQSVLLTQAFDICASAHLNSHRVNFFLHFSLFCLTRQCLLANMQSVERRNMQTLKEARERKGVKQVAVADYLGVARQTYANYEQNQEQMSIEQAKAVCKFLGVDVADIFLPIDIC
jgi:putative transcriptional regulator